VERADLGVALPPLAAPRLAGDLFVPGAPHGRHPVRAIGEGDALPLRAMRIKEALAGLAQVPQDVPPIRDLLRLGCPIGDAARVLGGAIPADDLDAGCWRSQAARVPAVRSGRRSMMVCSSRSAITVP